MTEGLVPGTVVWGALALAAVASMLSKKRVQPKWRTYKFKWLETMPVWWSILWRAVLYGAVGGHFVGNGARIIAMFIGQSDLVSTSGSVASGIAAVAFSTVAVNKALELHIGRLTGAPPVPAPLL
jgi:hypothetical protein